MRSTIRATQTMGTEHHEIHDKRVYELRNCANCAIYANRASCPTCVSWADASSCAHCSSAQDDSHDMCCLRGSARAEQDARVARVAIGHSAKSQQETRVRGLGGYLVLFTDLPLERPIGLLLYWLMPLRCRSEENTKPMCGLMIHAANFRRWRIPKHINALSPNINAFSPNINATRQT